MNDKDKAFNTFQHVAATIGRPLRAFHTPQSKNAGSRAAMSKPNGLLGQKSCRYLNQGRTFDDILMRAAQ